MINFGLVADEADTAPALPPVIATDNSPGAVTVEATVVAVSGVTLSGDMRIRLSPGGVKFVRGVTTVKYTATDAGGNADDTCTLTVAVFSCAGTVARDTSYNVSYSKGTLQIPVNEAELLFQYVSS